MTTTERDDPPGRVAAALAAFVGRETAPDVCLFAAVAGRCYTAGLSAGEAPQNVRRAAEASLVTGRRLHLLDGERRWCVHSIDDPAPALVALGAARRRCGADQEARLHVLRATLAEEILPAAAIADPFLFLAAASPALTPLAATLRRIAPTRLPVLLLGETGTGKEDLARALHKAAGRSGPFVAENCAALPEALLEAELFGVRRGAFTGATEDRKGRILEAHGGTLLLDEVGDLPWNLQAKLLRTLQEREVRPLGGDRPRSVDVRIVSATHHQLESGLEEKRFRRDLYYRLAGVVVEAPPLQERLADLPCLVAALLARLAREGLGPGRRITASGLAALARRSFPGNVRELDNLLRRAAALSPGPVIPAELFAPRENRLAATAGNLEIRAILDALALSAGVKAQAAERLGWTRQKLYRRLDALGLPRGPRVTASSARSTSRLSSAE